MGVNRARTAKGRRQGQPAGLDRPSPVERFAALLPVSYHLAALLWSIFLGPPAIVALNLIYTGGDLGRSVELFFPQASPPTPWQRALAAAFWTFSCWYGFWMIRYIRTRLQSAEGDIAPLLPEGQAGFRRTFAPVIRPIGGILVGLFLDLLFLRTALITYRNAPGPLLVVWRTLYPTFFFLLYGAGSWVYISALWGLGRLGKQELKLSSYHVDNMMGLGAIGSLSLSISSAFFGFLGIITIQMLLGPLVPEYLPALAAMLVLGVVLFFLPLHGIHKLMRKEKGRLRVELNDRLVQAIERGGGAGSRGRASPAAELKRLASELKNVLTLGLVERKLESLAVWPFDTRILGKLSAIVLSVIAGLIINVLVKRVLKL